ncbi:MAG TPA: DOMON-like domain-containing protein [Candidatus Binatia bacterium]|nr:DOMON-like domain-containing protein [Candidatus Binatia bacterium]
MTDSLYSLKPFADGQNGVQTIDCRLGGLEQNQLHFTYVAKGNIGRLRLPAKSLPRRADRLWQHTCFEAFVRVAGDPSYYEFNFSPSGNWAAYWFRAYRDGRPLPDQCGSPEIVVRCEADRIELDAVVRLDSLSSIHPGPTLRLGLSAVIEANDGTLSYWALKHPGAKPDFHHPDSFALELAFPSQGA